MADFRGAKAIDYIIDVWEKRKYTNIPTDLGGPTIFGITEKLARRMGFTRDMQTMTFEEAIAIYSRAFWQPLSLDLLDSQLVAAQILQAAINQGQPLWSKYIQEVCNEMLPAARRVEVDGYVGPQTMCALNLVLTLKGEKVLSRTIYDKQKARYAQIILRNPKQKVNEVGWNRRADDFLVA